MNNKVLIKLYVPEYGRNFDVYIPVNLNREFILINKDTDEIYNNNAIIRDTNIRNGSEIIIISY